MTYLLDTNAISEFTKLIPNQNVVQKIESLKNECAISCITQAELWFGVYLLPKGKKRRGHEEFVREKVEAGFSILPFDNDAPRIFSEIRALLQKRGIQKSVLDLQIAATAIASKLILVTRNIRDFKDIPRLRLENWFEPKK